MKFSSYFSVSHIVMDQLVKRPLSLAWAVPKVNPIAIVCHIQVYLSRNYISMVISSPNHISPPSTVAIFLTTHLMVVLQPFGYSIFHSRDTPIQLNLPWQSYFCQYLNTKTSAWGNRGFTTETPNISYTICLCIRLVVIL